MRELHRRRLREADVVAAHHRHARRRLPRARRDDGVDRRSARLARPRARVAHVADRHGSVRGGGAGRRDEPRVARGRRVRCAGARSSSTRASRRARASVADPPTRPRCSSRSTAIPRSARRLGADVPFCMRGGFARVGGIGDELQPDAVPALAIVVATPPFGCSTADVYRAWDELGGPRAEVNDLEPAAEHVEPRLAAFRREVEAAAGAHRDPRRERLVVRGRVRGRAPRPRHARDRGRGRGHRLGLARVDGRRRGADPLVSRSGSEPVPDAKRPPRWGGRCLLTLLTTLPAGLLQQLLVLLLAHALAALLDQ